MLVDAGDGCRAAIESPAQPTNLACAIAIALSVDVPWSDIASRLDDLPRPEHRQELAVAASGVHVIDNTFSSNPASAESSLSLLAFTGDVDARRVVVTPGMVELGRSQYHENERFGSRRVARRERHRRGGPDEPGCAARWCGRRARVGAHGCEPRGSRRVGSLRARARRCRALRERPARPPSLIGPRPLPACPRDSTGHLVRGALSRARHQRADRASGGRPRWARTASTSSPLYWARSGDFFEVDTSLAPSAFVEGVPRGAHRLDLVARPGGGFVPEGGRLGRRGPLDIDRGRELLPWWPRRGRHAAGRARPRVDQVHRPECCRCCARHGQARVRRRHPGRGARRASPRRVRPRSRAWLPRPLHREAAVRRLEHRDRDHRRPERRRRRWCAPLRTTEPAR